MERMTPNLGLVCMTASEECRFRTITRTRFLALAADAQQSALVELYQDNVERLARILDFCRGRQIKLYRMSSTLFPMSDEPLGRKVLRAQKKRLSQIGSAAISDGIRIVNHPDQFVVLSSDSPQVVRNSVLILKKQTLVMDLLGLPKTSFASIILHGGKAGRSDQLVRQIGKLPADIRSRLCLENDEYGYSSAEILDICRRAKVPMVFDNHHHAIHESLDNYDDPSFADFTTAARKTWPNPNWQLVHLSNGCESFRDRKHSDLIAHFPRAYANVPWIEVEAKGKEDAIAALRLSNSPMLYKP